MNFRFDSAFGNGQYFLNIDPKITGMRELRSLIAPLQNTPTADKPMKRKTHTKRLLAAVSVAGLILSSTVSHADPIYTWLGTVDDDWENADNWDASGVPVDYEPDRSGLSFENSNPDRIVINATNFSPTTNVPQLNPGHGPEGTPLHSAVTPTVDVLNGHVAFSLNSVRPGSGHTELDDHTFTTIGDGDASNGLASLTYTNPGQFRRGGNFTMSVTVNSDGSFIFGSGSTLARTGALQVTLAGGSAIFNGTVQPQHGNSNPGDGTSNNWFDFTAVGASFTAAFGSIFADLNWVNYYIDDGDPETGDFFRSSTNLELEATDNGDGTFTVAVATSGTSFPLTITQNASTPGTFDFEWDSQPGKVYDLLTSTDLADPISEWPIYDDGVTVYESIPSAGETTTLTAVPSTDPRRFFAMREADAPPPPPLFAVDFEDDNGGFTASTDEGTAWEWGTPDSSGPGGSVDAGNDADPGTGRAWGTNLGAYDDGAGDPGFYANPTTNSRLISPDIDLTEVAAAELTFAQAIDLDQSDSAVVRIYDAATGDEIVGGDFPLTVTDPDVTAAPWEASGPHALPVGSTIRIEWILNGTGGALQDYTGWYIDDVAVTETTP